MEEMFLNDDIFSDEEYKLVLSVVKRGFETDVLETAKTIGHTGATVIQAKGVSKFQKKFLGFSLDPENTLVMMVVKKELVVPLMKSIYSVIDYTSEARGMVFALPVSLVAGMGSYNENDKNV